MSMDNLALSGYIAQYDAGIQNTEGPVVEEDDIQLYKSTMSHHQETEKEPRDRTKIVSRHEHEEVIGVSKHIWDSLPDSINGTLIYFLL